MDINKYLDSNLDHLLNSRLDSIYKDLVLLAKDLYGNKKGIEELKSKLINHEKVDNKYIKRVNKIIDVINIYNKIIELIIKNKSIPSRQLVRSNIKGISVNCDIILNEIKDNDVYPEEVKEIINTVKEKYIKSPATNLYDVGLYEEASKKRIDCKKRKIYIITSAQNNTPIHVKFFKNILAYKSFLSNERGINEDDVELIVIPFRYKNPTSVFIDADKEIWDQNIIPYLFAGRMELSSDLIVLGDIKIQPTMRDPLNGVYKIARGKNVVVGHTKQHYVVYPGVEHPIRAFSTGAVTVLNYTDSRIGKLGEFHHTLGFVIYDGFKNDIRYVSADNNGNFYDLNVQAYNGEAFKVDNHIEGIVLSDIHLYKVHEPYLKKTIKLINEYKPKEVVLHDVLDSYSISHHHKENLFIRFNKSKTGQSLKDELDKTCELLVDILNKTGNVKFVVVESNHDEHLDKWLNTNVISTNIENLYEYSYLIITMIENNVNSGAFQLYFKTKYLSDELKDRIIFLRRKDLYSIKDWIVSFHGDISYNGNRGSLESFRKIGNKIIIGHSHTPGRKDNVAQVGVMMLPEETEYIKGVSTWLCEHVIIYNNGKIQHIKI